MTMNPLPPQAYTKDTLLKAYQWLMLQNQSIKEMATTPDILISLYLKATRDGDQVLDRPSIKNFKSELRNLAGMMGELDRPVSAPTPAPSTAQTPSPAAATPHYSPPAPHGTAHEPAHTHVSYTEKTMTATTRKGDLKEFLDPQSQDMIREVKEAFNLSSDLEALRMLVKVGYSRSKNLLS